MVHLALKGGSVSAREIAEQHEIPVELLAKILQQLTRKGLLVSQQGTRGGYELSQAAAGISVATVVCAIDGPVVMTACKSRAKPCPRFDKCTLRGPMSHVAAMIEDALAKMTIGELAVAPAAENEQVIPQQGRF